MEYKKIVELIKKGSNDKAMRKLYNYYPVVKKFILKNGGTTADAEDMYQEALIIFCRKAAEEGFNLTSSINTYLYSVCRYLWKDELKRKDKQTSINQSTQEEYPEQLIANDIEEEAKITEAEKVITQLGERCRELLLLFYTTTLKLKEIAVKMNYKSENAAKVQKYKCLESARNMMK